jgi:hypothetical protein
MLKISALFKKSTAIALLLAVGMSALSVSSAFAAGASPTTSTAAAASADLQANWKYEVASNATENNFVNQLDRTLDLSKSAGDLSALHEDRLFGREARIMRDANMILSKEQALITAHTGFDASGNITDQTQASQTVEQLAQLTDFYNGRLYFELRNIS